MADANLQDPIFTDENAAREALEASRWPNGPYCPKCGCTERQARVGGTKKSHRPGLIYCNECKVTYTATVGTVFERSKVPLTKWWLATHLLTSSKKGISSHQLHRMLGVSYKTAWFMSHRIREAMKDDPATSGPLGGEGKTVEVDETYFGPKTYKFNEKRGKWVGVTGGSDKGKVIALVERGGRVRSIQAEKIDKELATKVLLAHTRKGTALMSDESGLYTSVGSKWLFDHFASHDRVMHSADEYVRYEKDGKVVHSNTIEGYFSVFKRGMRGVYQQCGVQHLHRYLAEFDFRYNTRTKLGVTDEQRLSRAMKGINGKRLTYRRINEGSEA